MADDRTQFYIDILAKMTGGDTAVANVAALGDKMLAGGAAVADFERTIKSMSGALEDSGAAVKAASGAVSDGEARYRELEASADKAAKAVERMNASGKSGGKFGERLLDAGIKAEAAAAALKAEASALDALKSKAGAAAAQHDALSRGLKNVKGALVEATKAQSGQAAATTGGTGKVNEIAEALGKLGGPAGVAGQRIFGLATGFKKLGTSIGSVGLYVGVAVAIVAIATAALFATAAIGRWAVGLADANRTNTLLVAGVARSVAGGEKLEASISKIAAVVPLSNDELLSMASNLANSGLRGDALSAALERAAVKAAKLKFGPDFQKQLLSLDFQSKRLGTNLAETFGGLKIEGLLGGISTLVALFDSSTASGKALKFLFETLFQPIIDATTAAIPKVERLFLYAEILALKAYLALRPYSEQIATVGKVFAIGAAIIAGVVVVAIASFIAHIAIAVGLIGAIVFGLYKLEGVILDVAKAIFTGWNDAVQFMTDLGLNMVMGLVNGITGAATAVVKAVRDVVSGGIKAAENLLKIGSPSKLFEEMGGFTAQGFTEGVEGGAGDAQGALESLVSPPSPKGVGLGSALGSGASIVVQSMIVQGENAKELAVDFIEQITQLLEGDAGNLGGGEVPANA